MPLKRFGFRILLLFLLIFIDDTYMPFSMRMGVALLLISLDYKHLLCLKNYFLVYCFFILSIGGYIFFPDEEYHFDYIIISLFFLLGYLVSYNIKYTLGEQIKSDRSDFYEYLLYIVFQLNLGLVFWNIYESGGIQSYLNGFSLTQKIEAYGTVSLSRGVKIVIEQFISITSSAILALYIKYCLLKGKINKKLIFGLLVVIPLVSLSRAQMAFNLLGITLIYSLFNNRRGVFNKTQIFSLLGIFLLIFVYGTIIGGLRDDKLSGISSSILSNDKVLVSLGGELSPIIVYNDINKDIGIKLDVQNGKTIVLPLLFKIIPSAIYPNKPVNTITYYSKVYTPEAYDSGFMLATTIFSDLLINFDFWGMCLVVIVIGLYVGKMDKYYFNGNFNKVDNYIILHLNFYSLLRNNLSNSLSTFLFTLIVAYLIENIKFVRNENRN